MDKIIIFSHDSDIDGLGCVVLAKLAFKDVKYIPAPNVEKLELIFREFINSNELEEYDRIFVTDLSLYDPSLSMVANSNLKDKVLVFDHHKRAIELKMDRYQFSTVIEEDTNGKKCATLLFYNYLLQSGYLKPTRSLDQFVELTRLEDTWEWKNKGNFGQEAHDLAILFSCIGKDEYVSKVTDYILSNKNNFLLDNNDLVLINNKKEEFEENYQSIISSIEYFIDEDGNNFGIVYANYEYRNELPEYIIEKGNPNSIKYLIIVAMDKGDFGQKSYRSIDKSFDVNHVAMKHGGGGHPGAAAVNISKDQKEKALSLPRREGLKYLAECKYI